MTDSSNGSFENNSFPLQPKDAAVKVRIPRDYLSAYLYVDPPENGGKDVLQEMLTEELNKNKITFGIIDGILKNIEENRIYGRDVMVAQGIAPVDGNDGTYELLFDMANEGKPKEGADGKVDFHDLGFVKNVKENQPLCSIVLPTKGKDGTSVFGGKLSAKNGKAVPSMTGKNTKLSEDGKVIYATINGHVSFAVGKINVSDTLFIKENVDNSTGNIITNSNIVVTGTVLPGFSVESEGDIQIGGTVSGSSIKAGGNVVLRNGIIRGKLECEGDLTTKFIENCDVFVKGSVKADYIMNCRIVCAKSIQASGIISKIVGGSLVAGEDITARIIGTSSYTKTYIEIGTDPTVVSRQQELIQLIPDLKAKVASLQSLISLFQQLQKANRLTEDKKQAFYDAVYSYKTSSELLKNGKQELEEITEAIKKRGFGRVICRGTIYPGTTVKIGDFKMAVNVPIVNKALFYTVEGIGEVFAT